MFIGREAELQFLETSRLRKGMPDFIICCFQSPALMRK